MASISAVIVTYNRLNKLKVALECFDKQTKPCDYLIVVNNASTDGTAEYLAGWQTEVSASQKLVINMERNTGGSGGFYRGLEEACQLDADWVWVSDDDAYPEPDAIEIASKYLDGCHEQWPKISAICGKVMNCNKIAYMHRKSLVVSGHKVKEVVSTDADYAKDEFEINDFSYVGTLINKDKLLKYGLTQKDYFIWYDDSEHSIRLSKHGRIICLPNIVIHHDVPDDDCGYSWKTYYGLRNEWDLWHRHFPAYCFWFDVIMTKYKIFERRLRGRKKEETDILEAALDDALAGRFGIHAIYKPGWKPKEK